MKNIKTYELFESNKEVDGSGLFFFRSDVPEDKQLAIVRWYNQLQHNEKEYVDILIREAKDDAEFHSYSP